MNFDAFNWLDYLIIAILVLSCVISLIRGFVREALSLTSWIVAFWVGLSFSVSLANYLQPYISQAPLRTGLAFFALFAATLIIGAMINYLVTTVVDRTGLSGTDRLLGVVFGFGRGVLLIAFLLLAAQMTSLPQNKAFAKSQLLPKFASVELWLKSYLPKNFGLHYQPPSIKEISQAQLQNQKQNQLTTRNHDRDHLSANSEV